jgi:hypothetical protein
MEAAGRAAVTDHHAGIVNRSAEAQAGAAVEAAEKLAAEVWQLVHAAHGAQPVESLDKAREGNEELQAHLDDVLRPFVRRIARKLHDGDWDCVDEADAFDRFPQEMYDYDDQEHAAWIRERLADATEYDEPGDVLRWSMALKAHTDKMEAGKS